MGTMKFKGVKRMSETFKETGDRVIKQRIDELTTQLIDHETRHRVFTIGETIEIKNKIKILEILLNT